MEFIQFWQGAKRNLLMGTFKGEVMGMCTPRGVEQ